MLLKIISNGITAKAFLASIIVGSGNVHAVGALTDGGDYVLQTLVMMDGDGFSVEGGVCGAVDCNDNESNVNPVALEISDDNIDNNCDGRADLADLSCMSGDRRDKDAREDNDDEDTVVV